MGRRMKTAGVVVIGNEILSGKVSENNANFLAAELRDLGVNLRSIEVVPDELDEIARAVSSASARFDYVFTTGGVGPTHDDVTLEGIARAFGVKTRRSEEFVKALREHCGDRVNDQLLRMADLPEGATLLWEDDLPIPVICVRNLFIFPGEPGLLRKKFGAIRERFQSTPLQVHRIFTTKDEAEIAALLEEAADAHPEVQIGSYPVYTKKLDYRVQVTIESMDGEEARRVADYLRDRIPPEAIVRVE